MRPRPAPAVVALGGGHGLYASLSAMRRLTAHLTAVVTVADDGGSSGRLRTELGALPPGDLRMALAALTSDDPSAQVWRNLLQHRFGGYGALAGHPVGNLIIAGLAELLDDPIAGLDRVGELLGSVGRVLPMSPVPLEIVADVASSDPDYPGHRRIRGQVAVATTPGRVVSVQLNPANPPACAEAVQAVRAADWVVLGPGSWFTSVLPHLLVPDLRAALVETSARRIVTLNLGPQAGETEGFSPATHLEVLAKHAPDLHIDVVLADELTGSGDRSLVRAAESMGARLVLASVAAYDGSQRHDHDRLAQAYAGLLDTKPPDPEQTR
ncbi:MAG: uridine diphosphate-N-acetylglucosamine-binding protein YvcK [Mycobacteriales bacterium]